MKTIILISLLLTIKSVFSESIVMVNSSNEEIYASYRNSNFENFAVYLVKGAVASEGFSDIGKIGKNILWRNVNDLKVKSFPIEEKYLKAKFSDIHFVYLGNDQWCIRLYQRSKSLDLEYQIIINDIKNENIPIECHYAFKNINKDWYFIELQVDNIQSQKVGLINSERERPTLLDFVRPKKCIKLNIKKGAKEYEAIFEFKELEFKDEKCFEVTVENDFVSLNVYKEYYGQKETLILNKKIPIIEKVAQKKKEEEEDNKKEETPKNEIK